MLVNAKMHDLIGFAVNGTYCYRLVIAPLAAGIYSVIYTIESGTGSIGVYLPPRLVASAQVSIMDAGSVSPIPTLDYSSLTVLALLVAALGCLGWRTGGFPFSSDCHPKDHR